MGEKPPYEELERRIQELEKDAAQDSRQCHLLDAVTTATDVMLVYLDSDFNFVWVNAAYAETCKMEPEEIIGKNHFALYPNAENEAIFRHVRDTGKEIFYKDKPFEFPDQPQRGVTYWDWSLKPVEDARGQVTGLVFSLRETTEHKKAGLALERSEAEKSLILDNADEVIAYHDKDRNLIWANKAYLNTTGLSLPQLRGKKCCTCWRLETICNNCPVTDALKTGKPQSGELTPENQPHWPANVGSWSIKAAPVRDRTGTIIGAIEVAHDITDRKKAEEELRKARDELELRVQERTAELEDLTEALRREIEKRKRFESYLKAEGNKVLRAYEQRDYLSRRLVDLLEKERTEFANALHDEIGQAMAAIAMQLELLKRDDSHLASRVEPIQEHLREAVRRAKGLCSNLRSEALEHFGLIPSIKELVDQTQKEFPIKVHLFTKDVPERLSESDKSLTVYRLVQEALTNIHKHAGAKEVFINLIGRDGKLLVTIEDDGLGFDYGTIKGRADLSEPHLGITIMRERTSMVGGTFQIETAPGKGTHILAEIPVESVDNPEVRD
jgi:PAS domain S-box-containing protein